MATDPDGKKLYTASADAFIRFWDVKTGNSLKAQYINQDSKHLASALLNWFELVYGPFGLSNMHLTLKFCPDQPGSN